MSESDLIALYSARILELTTQIPHIGRLPARPEGQVWAGTARSAQCGSTVAVEIALTDGRITAYAQTIKACALGQASAAIFGAGVVGQSPQEIADLRDSVAKMLAENGPAPADPFADYAVLRAAASYKNRHNSILLCMDAVLRACASASEKKPPLTP